MQWQQLSTEELQKLLTRETRIFIDALDNNTNLEELKATKKRISELKEILEKKMKIKDSKPN